MAKGIVEGEYLTNIANAIRSKNGTTNQYTPSNKTYIFSCSNILEGTQISINNENDKMLNGSKGLVQFTPSSDILNPQIIVWVNEGIVYNHTELAIKLEER